ncbi:MAG: hypothetical protein R3B89_23530 [Polyangiaceae bacterium]
MGSWTLSLAAAGSSLVPALALAATPEPRQVDAPLTPDPRFEAPTSQPPPKPDSATGGDAEFWLLVAPSRWKLETRRRTESAYGLRAGMQLIVPFEVTALLLDTSLEGTSLDDGVVVAWPVSIGYGLRLSVFEIFGGGTFGALFPNEYSEGGRIVGLFASAGLNLGAARFHMEFRYNYLLSSTSELAYVAPALAASFRL